MEKFVDVVYTETCIVPQKQFELLENNQNKIIVQTENAKSAAAVHADDWAFTDFPDLSKPLPDVSIREQMRLTTVNRGKVLSCQRSHERRLIEMWYTHSDAAQSSDKKPKIVP